MPDDRVLESAPPIVRPTKTVGDQLFERLVVMLYATSSTGPL